MVVYKTEVKQSELGTVEDNIYVQFCPLVAWLAGWGKVQGKFNTLGLRQDGHHFTDDVFKCIFFNENVWSLLKISL